MKINLLKSLMIIVFIYCYSNKLMAQPANEINCFRNFDVNATGRNDVNAYLLSRLSYLVYPQNLSVISQVSEIILQTDATRFKTEFVNKTKHYFSQPISNTSPSISGIKTVTTSTSIQNLTALNGSTTIVYPQFDFVTANDLGGDDPEVMLINTNNAVYVVVRGTDRVAPAGTFNYEAGEWIQTDFLAFLDAPYGANNNPAKGLVHKGFRDAISVMLPSGGNYIDDLTNRIAQMVGTSNKKVWFTGHSLGGAMAQLIAFYLKDKKNITPQGMVLFASAHAGNPTFTNYLNSIFSNGKNSISRYDMRDDPITRLPPRNWGYGRAGIRNEIVGVSNGIIYNTTETAGRDDLVIPGVMEGLMNFGGMCYHYPEWYTTACYNSLTATMKSQVPLPPTLPTASSTGCNQIDINFGTSGNYIDPGSVSITEGTYVLKNVRSGKLLSATRANCPINLNNCCPVTTSSNTSTTTPLAENKWLIEKVQGAILTSYTIKSVAHNTVLDADIVCAGSNNCKVQHCNRLLAGNRTNQEWAFVRMANGNYKIRCVAGSKYLRINPDCPQNAGCDFYLYDYLNNSDEEFILIKQ